MIEKMLFGPTVGSIACAAGVLALALTFLTWGLIPILAIAAVAIVISVLAYDVRAVAALRRSRGQ